MKEKPCGEENAHGAHPWTEKREKKKAQDWMCPGVRAHRFTMIGGGERD